MLSFYLVSGLQQAVAQHIRQHIQRQRQMGLLHFGSKHRHSSPAPAFHTAVPFDLQRDSLASRPGRACALAHMCVHAEGGVVGCGRLLVVGAMEMYNPTTQ